VNGDLFSVTDNNIIRYKEYATNNTNNGNEKSVSGNRRQRGRPRKENAKTVAERVSAYRKRKKKLIHFKSNCVEWSTPEDLFKSLDAQFHFTLDVCADAGNAKCPRYFTHEQDGLLQRWEGVCWMNPPYGREIGRWVQKAYDCSLYGVTVVCLLPARTDTHWWQTYILPLSARDLHFLPGRQHFSGKDRAPFPNAIAIFRPPLGDNHAD
jgi:phage N-6-adenine-methyltransferase